MIGDGKIYDAAARHRTAHGRGWALFLIRCRLASCTDSLLLMKLLNPYRLDPAVLLVGVLVAVNLLAVVGLVAARRDARSAVREGLALETRADARAFEARLTSELAQLEFLARSPPLTTLSTVAASDPVALRWARLDLEATLLLYMQSNPSVVELRVREDEEIRAVARRVGGVPSLASPGDQSPPDSRLLHAAWAVEESPTELEGWLDPQPLVLDLGDHLRLLRTKPEESSGPVERVSIAGRNPPFEAWIERSHSDDTRVLGAVERLADLYWITLMFNVALLPATLGLGALTLRRIRRLDRLENERQQQERLRALELQVQHSERLASLGRFAAGFAHEINNPLEGMANYVQLLHDDVGSGRLDAARQWLPRLNEGIDRVAGTVRQVLHFAEPGSAAHDRVDFGEVIERTVDFSRRHPDCREAVFKVRCEQGLHLEGDSVSLGQLVLNLVLNACQMQAAGGEVEIIGCAAPDGRIELRVLDTGPGISAEMRDCLFEPFQSSRGSSGLGLAVCHGLVAGHQGTIEALDRIPGPGAEILVRLPRQISGS